MVKRPAAVVVALLLLAGAGWFVRGWLWPDEQARVRAAIDALGETVSSATQVGPGPGQLAVIADLRNQVTDTVTLEAPRRALLVEGRDAVTGLVARLAGAATQVSLTFVDVNVSLTNGETMASVTATAQLVETSGTGSQSLDAQEVEMVWTRQGQTWQLASARAIDVLR